MMPVNYFIEGLQGAGKTTFMRQLSAQLPDYQVFWEGDYSPVELAWCACVTQEQYQQIIHKYSLIHEEIDAKTVAEGDRKIICYTQILTDIPGFHKDLEQYEIYNGNMERAAFEQIVTERFASWNGTGQIFECSLFQNIIENQILYFMMADDEILDFYRKLKEILSDKPYRIIYLDLENIGAGVEAIRKERSDDEGNDLWFPMMVRYMEESPGGKAHDLKGQEGLLRHLEHRKTLEHRIIEEIFKENAFFVKAKSGETGQMIDRLADETKL